MLIDAGAEGLRCPSNCSNCYQGKSSTDCYSYDKYGNFLGCQIFSGNATLMRALNDTTVANGISFGSFVHLYVDEAELPLLTFTNINDFTLSAFL